MPLDTKYKSVIESAILLGSAVILAVIISLSVMNFLGNSSMPNVAVSTTSMMPIYRGYQDGNERIGTLHPFRGDILLVKKVPIDTLQVGDVIVFDTPSLPDSVVHRIVAKWQNGSNFFFKTNGDNNNYPDGWVVEGDLVIGLVVIRIPHIGWFLLSLQTTLGKIIVLLLAGMLLFGEDILSLLGVRKEEEKEKQKESPEKNQSDFPSTPKSKKFTLRGFLNNKKFFYTSITLGIFLIFFTSNLVAGMTQNPSIKCYSITDPSHTSNLLESSPENPIVLTTTDGWMEGDSEWVYFYPVFIEIQSGGLFNNIDRFEVHVNQSEGFNTWTIVYNYIGSRTIKGAIISRINGTVEVSIHVYSRGLIASSLRIYSFPLLLQT